MACPHIASAAQAIIDSLTAEKTHLEQLKSYYNEQINNFDNYLENLSCVISKLEGISLIDGNSFDNGITTQNMEESKLQVEQLTNKSKECDIAISDINLKIRYQMTIRDGDGMCAECTPDESSNDYNKEE